MLGILGERVDRFARELRPFGNPYASYSSAFAQRSVERLKPTTADEVAQVFDGVPEPQVRLVGAVPFHGSGKRHPGKGGRHTFARLVPKRHQHRLHHCVDIVRRHEGRLQIDLGELRLPVGPQVLVPETTGELEIAIEPRSHQDLLVYLRRLGQRVELPGMHAGRDEVIAGTFRCGPGENRGFYLVKTEIRQGQSGPLQETVPQSKVSVEFGPPQIEVAVLQPSLLRGQFLALGAPNGNRRCFRGSHDAKASGVHLDVSSSHIRVPGAHRPGRDRALYQHHGFCAHSLGPGDDVGLTPVRIEHYLSDALSIAQVEEHDATEIAAAVHPATQSDLLVYVIRAECAAQVRPHCRSRHGDLRAIAWRVGTRMETTRRDPVLNRHPRNRRRRREGETRCAFGSDQMI